MEGTIVNFRMGRHNHHTNQMVIQIKGIEDKEKANALKGKKVIFATETGKKINGKVSSAHGSGGAIRAIFETGMPGQAIAKKVKIE